MSRGGQTPGAADAAVFAGVPVPGDLVASKYVVERVLGSGGMGVVIAARHVQLGQLVAIKFMRIEAAQDASAVNRFVREARAAAALSSEHVTRVLDVGTLESGAPYMVMEHLDGVDLGDLLRANGRLPIADAVAVVMQACEAIAEAHEIGIVHRDLKPSNLFVTKRRDGTPLVKVLDFGISKRVELNTQVAPMSLTVSGIVIGSPLYMSPEQLRSAKTVDARSDIWSLGVILYELLTGKAPFAGETLGEVLSRVVADTPLPIRRERPEIPRALEMIILECLERDIDRRIRSAGDLAAKLAPFAPREMATSAGRIGRASSFFATKQPAPRAGVHTATNAVVEGAERAFPPQAIETGPAWLQTGDDLLAFKQASRAKTRAAAVGFILVLAAAAAGIYLFRARATSAGPGTAVTASPPMAVSTTPAVSRQLPVLPSVVLPPVSPQIPAIADVEPADASISVESAGPPRTPRRPSVHSATTRKPSENDLLLDRR